MSERFNFIPIVPPYEGAGQEESVVAPYMERLEAMGGTRVAAGDLADSAPLVMVVATGGTESVVLAVNAERQSAIPGDPVLLLAHSANNSLPAAMEVLARLQQDGVQGRIVFVREVGDEAGFAQLAVALHDMRVRSRLHSARIGLVGSPSDWLVASSPEPAVVAQMWGPEVVPIEMRELEDAMAAATDDAVRASAESLGSGASNSEEPTPDDLQAVSRVLEGSRALVRAHALDALTVRCFDIVLSQSTSGCFALSGLIDDGIIAGCEGDLVSTVGMLWAHMLTGELPWMANPSDLDQSANTLLLAHCTIARGMVESYALRSHFESGLSVGIQGELAPGPVTLLRIGGPQMNSLWLAEGEITECGHAENRCRTQANVALTHGDVTDLLTQPLGNHIVLVRGHHADRLASWWETMR